MRCMERFRLRRESDSRWLWRFHQVRSTASSRRSEASEEEGHADRAMGVSFLDRHILV